jgi:hypothetical protein
LALNENVVTSNQYRLEVGTHVRIAAAATPSVPSAPAKAS